MMYVSAQLKTISEKQPVGFVFLSTDAFRGEYPLCLVVFSKASYNKYGVFLNEFHKILVNVWFTNPIRYASTRIIKYAATSLG